MSRRNKKADKIDQLEEKVKKIEDYIVKKNSTDVFENMQFLISMMKEFDASLGKAVNHARMMQHEMQFCMGFLSEKGMADEFQKWKQAKMEEMKPKPNEELDKKLDEQQKRLEELNEN